MSFPHSICSFHQLNTTFHTQSKIVQKYSDLSYLEFRNTYEFIKCQRRSA